jgi:hypothetical protein
MTLYWWKFLKFILNKNLLEVKNKEGRGKRGALNDRARASKYRGRRVRGALVLSARSIKEERECRLQIARDWHGQCHREFPRNTGFALRITWFAISPIVSGKKEENWNINDRAAAL